MRFFKGIKGTCFLWMFAALKAAVPWRKGLISFKAKNPRARGRGQV